MCWFWGTKFQVYVKSVEGWAKNKLKRKYSQIFQKVLMMVQELDYQAKGEAGIKGGGNGDLYIFAVN